MAVMIIPLIIRSFHRQPLEPIGCVMLTDLPWMPEPSHLTLWLCDCYMHLSFFRYCTKPHSWVLSWFCIVWCEYSKFSIKSNTRIVF